MSDVISRYMQRSYERRISVPGLGLSLIKQQGISRFQIALTVNIPYPLLKMWHENVQDRCDYIDFLNATVSRSWFRVERQATLSKAGWKEKQELCHANIDKLKEEIENSLIHNVSL